MQISVALKTDAQTITGFKYLWLKTVTGFDPNEHCARCLKGAYNKGFNPRMPVNTTVTFEYPAGTVLYFCGVSSPYKWANNFHFAGVVSDKNVETQHIKLYNGDVLEITGVVNTPIIDAYAKSTYSNKGKEFLTCRNFQFGASLEALILKPNHLQQSRPGEIAATTQQPQLQQLDLFVTNPADGFGCAG